MLVKPLAGNCSARVVYNLGTAHDWRDKVITYDTFEAFKQAMNKKIKNGPWGEDLTYIATTLDRENEYGGQQREQEWLRKLGFKEMNVGNEIIVWGITSCDYHERNQ